LLSAALAGAALFVFTLGAQAANPRIALVIGESAYPDQALPTTANDAGLVAQVLQAAGFDVVGARDLDQKGVRESLRDFLDKANQAGPDMQAFVYFSGRAFQYAGDNYLAPIDARVARDSDAPIEAVKLSDFTHALAAAPGLARVVVIDGARPNPYAQTGAPLAGGLALVDPEPNTVIAFNAAPGAVGVEDQGDYGVYAKTLAGLLRQGGVDITEILAETRVEVNQRTQGAQMPWNAGKLAAPYFLFERAADAPPPKKIAKVKQPLKQLPAQEAYQVVIERDDLADYEEFLRDHARSEQAKRVEAILAARREALFWRRTLESNTPRAYWTYLRRYPKGPHSWDAGRRLDALAARREPPPDFEVLEYQDVPPPPPRELVYADRPVFYFGGDDFGPPPPPPPRDYYVYEDDADDWRDLPPPPRPTVEGVLPTLAVAIPLLLAARAYHDRPRRDGVAPPSAPPPPPRPIGPPPLPRGVVAKAPPPSATPAPQPQPTAPGQKPRGEVKFVAPPPATPGGRPPAPTPVATTAPKPGVSPAPTAPPTPGASPTRAPLPTPGLTPKPGASPTPAPSASPTRAPLPTPSLTPKPGASPTPTASPTPAPSASPTRAPLPTPSVTPKPGASPTPTPAPSASPTRAPLPTPGLTPKPGASPTPTATTAPKPAATVTPEPRASRTPATPSDAAEPRADGGKGKHGKPEGDPGEKIAPVAPATLLPTPALKPKAELPKATPMPVDTPKLREKPKPETEASRPKAVEAPKPAPAPKAVEAPKPAPPPVRAEAPPRAEAPRPAQAAPAAHQEPAKPAPAAACGRPGQSKC
jgi:uncharacterized caspase-like protein